MPNVENIREKCRLYLPEIAVFKVILSKFYKQDYENGLIDLQKIFYIRRTYLLGIEKVFRMIIELFTVK